MWNRMVLAGRRLFLICPNVQFQDLEGQLTLAQNNTSPCPTLGDRFFPTRVSVEHSLCLHLLSLKHASGLVFFLSLSLSLSLFLSLESEKRVQD